MKRIDVDMMRARNTRQSGDEKMRVLAVGAHPDDVEFLMAGTLTLLRRRGFNVSIATVATGDMGSMTLGTQEIASERFREATSAARVLDASYECLGESDLHIVFDNPTRFKVTELVRRAEPDIVFTHSPQDYMKDHELTADLVWDACFNASVPNYSTNQPKPAKPTTKTPCLFYADALGGRNRFGDRTRPAFYIDVTSVMGIKKEMLAKHRSQRSWLRAQHGVDEYKVSMKNWARERGKEVRVKYAEAFTQHRSNPFPSDNILKNYLPVLYGSGPGI